jgi:hypothetical protein
MNTAPPFDYPALAQMAALVHDLDQARPWPPGLADELREWSDTNDPSPQHLCLHLADGKTQPLYGFAHQPRVILCADCFTEMTENVSRGLGDRCQRCARPHAETLRIAAGYLTITAQLCQLCAQGQRSD